MTLVRLALTRILTHFLMESLVAMSMSVGSDTFPGGAGGCELLSVIEMVIFHRGGGWVGKWDVTKYSFQLNSN